MSWLRRTDEVSGAQGGRPLTAGVSGRRRHRPADWRRSTCRNNLCHKCRPSASGTGGIGSCREADPELFFHPQNERGLARLRRDRAAKAVCARCGVRIDCAIHAIRAREPYGVWGGLTEEERARCIAHRSCPVPPPARRGCSGRGRRDLEAVSPGALGVVS